MNYSQAKEELYARIDRHPKDGSVDDILDSLSFAGLADEAAHDARGRSQMISSLRDVAKARLYEETEPAISEAGIGDKRAGNVARLFPDADTEYPEHLWWLERWVYFRIATELGQMYMRGKPAVKYIKEDDAYELGMMHPTSTGGVGYKTIITAGTLEETRTAIRQTRESFEEHPTTHRNADVLADGWERLLDHIE